jgi:hypothetical protein
MPTDLVARSTGETVKHLHHVFPRNAAVIVRRLLLVMPAVAVAAVAAEPARYDYRVLATNRTSTMEKEMNAAADAGYSFFGVMGGETGFGGNEAVVVMGKDLRASNTGPKKYKLLATSRTGTMQKELQQAGEEGFEFLGMTVGKTAMGGNEVVCFLRKVVD